MDVDLRGHGRRYAPTYPPNDHSDHFPMAWLALAGLNAPQQRRARFAAAYLPRLVGLPGNDGRERQEQLLRDIANRGVAGILQEQLPPLISGWFRGAYHPLIRLGYGVEFDIPEEVAAGLCYLETCGASPRLAELAQHSRPAPEISGTDLFRQAAGLPAAGDDSAGFTARAEAALGRPEMPDLARVVPDNLRQISYAALSAFASTHDFFALHLVTASHAFRIVHRYAGPDADAVLNLGLLAGYLAIGAPPIRDVTSAPAFESESARMEAARRLLALCRDDEHDLKLAYSATVQAGHWRNTAYVAAAESYLTR